MFVASLPACRRAGKRRNDNAYFVRRAKSRSMRVTHGKGRWRHRAYLPQRNIAASTPQKSVLVETLTSTNERHFNTPAESIYRSAALKKCHFKNIATLEKTLLFPC
ncbi:hypothetical protein [Janthinobacterium sp.]|uniref:hypothetical protein n=1 Tax=Janthinobacterium sp. TaxID=1871054 RepID=UPI002625811E|nr:hypothetical protein [Janthinobacterium sp.]